MGTIEIHEPEVVQEVKPASRAAAAVLPRTELVTGPPLPPRPMFSDSLLEFGVQRKRKFFATTTSFIVNCLAILLMLAVPLMFTEELPQAQLLTFLVAPAAPAPASSASGGRGAEGGASDPDRHAQQWRVAHALEDSTEDSDD